MDTFPLISHAQVTGVNPATGLVQVQFPSGMIPAFNARMMYHGPADGLRVKQVPMPVIGSWVLVCCPYGDSRNATILGGIYTSGIDARTGDTDPYVAYDSHWSGAFTHMDGQGNFHQYFPDGSYISFATSTALPSITRHTVNAAQQRVATSFPANERTATTVAARPYLLSHSSGTTVEITAAGAVTTAAVTGQPNTLTGSGATVEITGTGAITATAKTGQTIIFTANGTVFEIDGSGNVQTTLASGAKWNLSDGGGASDFLVLAQLLVTAFNNHVHVNGGGSGNSGVPATPLTAAGISSSLIGVQS